MVLVLTPENAESERRRLLAQAKHCSDLAGALKDEESVQQLAALARSYEATALLVVVAF